MSVTREEKILQFVIKTYNELPRVAKILITGRRIEGTPKFLQNMPDSVKKCTIENLLEVIYWAHQEGRLPF